MMDKKVDYKKLKIMIERLIPFEELTDVSFGTVYCPFHDNRRTKAAKFYLDDDNVVRLFCFAENKIYTSYDYLRLIRNVNPIDFLKSKYSDKELDKLMIVLENNNCFDDFINSDVLNDITNKWVDSEEDLKNFLDDIYTGYYLNEV